MAVKALRVLATLALVVAGLVLFLIVVVNLGSIGNPGCMPGREHTASDAFGLIGLSAAMPAAPGGIAIWVLKKRATTTFGAFVAFAFAGVALLGAFAALAMNVFGSLC